MFPRKLSPLFTVSLGITATWLLAALLLAAPAPEDKAVAGEEAAEPAKATEEEAAEHFKTSENNLKQIGLAFHNYLATMGTWPCNITSEDGKPLLSWRVVILPYIEQDNLYKTFNMDEPWDSENNKKLIEKKPDIYASPRVALKNKAYTVYQGFAGDGTLFEPGKKLRIADITDGTSNTIMVVESSVAVPWTKPVDLPFDAKKDLPDIGKAYGAKPLAALCDGSVRTLNLKTLTPETFKAAITISGGEVLGADW
jgi:hypothetical protein